MKVRYRVGFKAYEKHCTFGSGVGADSLPALTKAVRAIQHKYRRKKTRVVWEAVTRRTHETLGKVFK